MTKIVISFFVLGALSGTALAAPVPLSDSQMDAIAAGSETVNVALNQTANSASTATCMNCTTSGTSGIGVDSTSLAINITNVREVVTGNGTHSIVTSRTLNTTVDQNASSTSAAACTNCAAAAGGAAGSSGINVNSTSQAINIVNVREVVTGGAVRKDGAITLNTTIDQTANSTSTAACTNCTATGAAGIGVNSTSQALNIANVRQVVGGGPKAADQVTFNTTLNQTANSTSSAACTNCTAPATAGIGVNSTSLAFNIGNVHQVVAGVSGAAHP